MKVVCILSFITVGLADLQELIASPVSNGKQAVIADTMEIEEPSPCE